jgi:hypothetical protein
MATAKKSASRKKSTAKKPAAKKSPAKKTGTAAKKAAPRKAKFTPRSPAAKKRSRRTSTSSTLREDKLAAGALKLVDEAAGLLRTGIRTGAAGTAKARQVTKKRAQSLINRASDNLGKALDSGASLLKGAIGKL